MSGPMTSNLGRMLSTSLGTRGLDVLYDHGVSGQRDVGKPTLWIGTEYSNPALLGFLDIAVVERETDRALVLFEIEETSAQPKQLLGDVFATLFSEHLTINKSVSGAHREVDFGEHTTLAVLVQITDTRYVPRLRYLQNQIETLKPFALRDVILDSFVDEEELQRKAMQILGEATDPGAASGTHENI